MRLVISQTADLFYGGRPVVLGGPRDGFDCHHLIMHDAAVHLKRKAGQRGPAVYYALLNRPVVIDYSRRRRLEGCPCARIEIHNVNLASTAAIASMMSVVVSSDRTQTGQCCIPGSGYNRHCVTQSSAFLTLYTATALVIPVKNIAVTLLLDFKSLALQ